MRKFHAQIIPVNGKPTLDFGTDYSRAIFKNWMKENLYKFVTIEPREKITREARGYFEGALCPAYLSWMERDPHDNDAIEKVRELFKLEFNGEVIAGLSGDPIKIARSTAKLSKDEFRREFIAEIVEYFAENEIPIPNPELYRAWKNKWANDYPLLTFWQFLEKFKLKPNTAVSEVLLPKEEIKVEYPKENLTPTF